MQKFRSLVKESRVILIPFDHEIWPCSQFETLAKIPWNPSHHETRIQACVFENPGDKRGRRGLSVGTADDNGFLALHGKSLKSLGERKIRDAQPGKLNRLRIELCDDIADNDQIRSRMKVLRLVSLKNRYGQLFQELAHGRVDILVRACHDVALLLEDPCQRGHGRSANPHEVDMTETAGKGIEVRGKRSDRGWSLVFGFH